MACTKAGESFAACADALSVLHTCAQSHPIAFLHSLHSEARPWFLHVVFTAITIKTRLRRARDVHDQTVGCVPVHYVNVVLYTSRHLFVRGLKHAISRLSSGKSLSCLRVGFPEAGTVVRQPVRFAERLDDLRAKLAKLVAGHAGHQVVLRLKLQSAWA